MGSTPVAAGHLDLALRAGFSWDLHFERVEAGGGGLDVLRFGSLAKTQCDGTETHETTLVFHMQLAAVKCCPRLP